MIRLNSDAGRELAEVVMALADADRLSRGRTYQRKGKARVVSVEPGVAEVEVLGTADSPYRVVVATRPAGDNARAAAELDPAAAVPAPGDVALSCDCPDWGDPCKHGVAALLQLACDVDDDPSVLLRWRDLEDVVAPAPPGTGPLVDPDPPTAPDDGWDDEVDGGTVRPLRRRSRSSPGDEVAGPVFGAGLGPGAEPDDPVWDELVSDDLDDPDAARGRGRRPSGERVEPEVPDRGDAVAALRRLMGPRARSGPLGATPRTTGSGTPAPDGHVEGQPPGAGSLSGASGERLSHSRAELERLRRRLADRLVDPESLVPTFGGPVDADDEPVGALGAFLAGPAPDAIAPPPPLEEVPLDAFRRVRIMVEQLDAAPVLADAVDTVAEHWLSR